MTPNKAIVNTIVLLFVQVIFIFFLTGCNPEISQEKATINKWFSARGIAKISGNTHEQIIDNTFKRIFSDSYFTANTRERYFTGETFDQIDSAGKISDFIVDTKSYEILFKMMDRAFGDNVYSDRILGTRYSPDLLKYLRRAIGEFAANASFLSLIKLSTLQDKPDEVFNYLNDLIFASEEDFHYYDEENNAPSDNLLLYYISALIMKSNGATLFEKDYPNTYKDLYEHFPNIDNQQFLTDELYDKYKLPIDEFIKTVSNNKHFMKYGIVRSFPASEKIQDKITFKPERGAYIIIYDDSIYHPPIKTLDDNINFTFIPSPYRYKTDNLFPASDPSTADLIIYEKYSYEYNGRYTALGNGKSFQVDIFSRNTEVSVVDSQKKHLLYKYSIKTKPEDEYEISKMDYMLLDDYSPQLAEIEKSCLH